MGDRFSEMSGRHQDFVSRQHVFFTATAAPTGRVNVSPRPTTALKIISPTRVVYMDRIGSGNETAAHLKQSDRMTIMFCAVDGPPQIMRLYGKGRIIHRGTPEYAELLEASYDGEEIWGTRQLVLLDIDLVQTSCGFGVPLFDYQGERQSLDRWAENKSADDLKAYQQERNMLSIDGFPTGLFEDT